MKLRRPHLLTKTIFFAARWRDSYEHTISCQLHLFCYAGFFQVKPAFYAFIGCLSIP